MRVARQLRSDRARGSKEETTGHTGQHRAPFSRVRLCLRSLSCVSFRIFKVLPLIRQPLLAQLGSLGSFTRYRKCDDRRPLLVHFFSRPHVFLGTGRQVKCADVDQRGRRAMARKGKFCTFQERNAYQPSIAASSTSTLFPINIPDDYSLFCWWVKSPNRSPRWVAHQKRAV